jgi:hypothetical protein
MPLSTSNSERLLPDVRWLPIFGTALLICFTFVALMEIRLAQLGYHPTILDSKERWADERARASQLGKRALIIIGASRIQLGLDLEVLRRETGLEPVQLAVDGSSFVPILKGLADDPTIRGTILVDYSPMVVAGAVSGDYGAATAFQRAFDKRALEPESFSLARMEKLLAGTLHENLRSFADGATPLRSIQSRIIPGQPAMQYLVTLPDRSRLADYRLVSMPGFYHRRVIRNLGEEQLIDPAAADIEQTLRHKISLLQPQRDITFIQGARYLAGLLANIDARGGKVIFVEMPTSGMVREIEDKQFPRARFLDILKREIRAPILSSVNNPELGAFDCPDGSHLDFRDRSRFTMTLTYLLGSSVTQN